MNVVPPRSWNRLYRECRRRYKPACGINRSTGEPRIYTNYGSRYAEVGCVTIMTDLFGSETRDGSTISEGRRRDACNSRDKYIYTCIRCVSRDRLNYCCTKKRRRRHKNPPCPRRSKCGRVLFRVSGHGAITLFLYLPHFPIKSITCSNLICIHR